ncbi:MAG: UbiA family prenyltransferase [Pseudomonadota bacterium]
MSPPQTAARIIWESFSYRIRMREVNNLAVILSMMLAFRIALGDAFYRAIFALLLNMYAYLINDYYDVAIDLESPQKDQEKVRFLASNQRAAKHALWCLGAILAVGAAIHFLFWGVWLLAVAFVCSTVVVVLYSAWLKRIPIADLVVMAFAGASGTIIGIQNRPLGWQLLGLLSLLCCGYQAIQVIRDEPTDRERGVRTTAVFLGAKRTVWVFRAIMLFSAAYCWGIVGSYLGLVLLVTVVIPMKSKNASKVWDAVRVVSGTVWLGIMAQVFLGVF